MQESSISSHISSNQYSSFDKQHTILEPRIDLRMQKNRIKTIMEKWINQNYDDLDNREKSNKRKSIDRKNDPNDRTKNNIDLSKSEPTKKIKTNEMQSNKRNEQNSIPSANCYLIKGLPVITHIISLHMDKHSNRQCKVQMANNNILNIAYQDVKNHFPQILCNYYETKLIFE